MMVSSRHETGRFPSNCHHQLALRLGSPEPHHLSESARELRRHPHREFGRPWGNSRWRWELVPITYTTAGATALR